MILAQDLRIGNLVKSDNAICEVDAILRNGNISTNKGSGHVSEFQPIELTEEILLKCGFHQWFKQFDINCFTIDLLENGTCRYIRTNTIVKYLHELQNLYKSITNQELEIKL